MILCIKAVLHSTINVDDRHDLGLSVRKGNLKAYLFILDDWHYDLALRISITGYVTWELLYIGDELCLGGLSCSATDTPTERDGLTRNLLRSVVVVIGIHEPFPGRALI